MTFCYLMPFRDKFPNEKIPTLEEVVELCSSLELKMIIEIKKGTKVLEVRSLGSVFAGPYSGKSFSQVHFSYKT